MEYSFDQHFSGVTPLSATASKQIFPPYAFNFKEPPKTLVVADERLIAMKRGYQIVSDYVETEAPLKFLISGAPYSGKTSLGHEFTWYAINQVIQKEGFTPLLLYESAFERSPIAMARSLVHKVTRGAEIPLKTPLDVLITKLVEQTTNHRTTFLFLDDLYSAHAELVNELLLNAEDSNLQIFLSAMPDLEQTLKRRYHHTFKRQISDCKVILPDFDVILLAAIIKQEAADLFDIPLTTEQALFFAEVDQVLTAKRPVIYGTDRPFVKILEQLEPYKKSVLSGHDCRKITGVAATYEDFISVLDLSQDSAQILKKVLEDLKLGNEAGKCFIDKSDIFYYFEEEFLDNFQLPRAEKQYEHGRILGELEEMGSIIPSERLPWLYFCYYDVEDALAVLDGWLSRFSAGA